MVLKAVLVIMPIKLTHFCRFSTYPAVDKSATIDNKKEILEGIYELKFLDFTYGFRPNRSCHNAIQRVEKHMMADKVNYIVDTDIKGFFDNIDHDWLISKRESSGEVYMVRYGEK